MKATNETCSESFYTSYTKDTNQKSSSKFHPLLKFKENLYNLCQSKFSKYASNKKDDLKLMINSQTKEAISIKDYLDNTSNDMNKLTPIPFINKRRLKNEREKKEQEEINGLEEKEEKEEIKEKEEINDKDEKKEKEKELIKISENSGINIDLSPVTIPGKMSKNGENENNINSNNNGMNENVEKSQNENKINNEVQQEKKEDGDEVQVFDDEEEPSEEIIDKRTGKPIQRPKKKKIVNKDGEIENGEEIEDEEPTEIDDKTGKKKPKKKKYITETGRLFC